uniref:Ubiquitin-like protease family profile domain-containing protein n=1 Tax=Cannabis sativa TaxID=3483 RepID=A0A803PDM7_CANSA
MSDDVDFWFKINGTMVRFSIEKFSLITGLKCHGNDDESIFVEKDESLKKVLFKESKGLITKKEVRNAFIRKRAKGDVNMVKLGLVHFLANFLFGTVPETKVSNFFWNIVDSDDATFQQFPYGKLLWEKSRHSMRLSLMKKEEIFEKMFDEETGNIQPYSYKLFGFPYAFLIWIFETIPALSPTFCEKHIDVIMYYLRKKIMHSGTINLLVTTTDSIFYKVVRTTYESYLADGSNVINQETIIAKYMSGQSLSCSVSWYYLDHVAIPGHVTDEVHYILAHFNIRERCLVVYNSMIPKVNKKPVEKTVTTFSVLIHLFMECIGFYNTRAGIDFNQGPYAVARSHPLAVKFAKGVPQQEDCDCGAFVIAFADHIIHDTINGISPKLNIANYRDDLAVCLYHHAKKKQEDGYKAM